MKIRHKLTLMLVAIFLIMTIIVIGGIGKQIGSIKMESIREAQQFASLIAYFIGYEMSDPVEKAIQSTEDLQKFVENISKERKRDITVVDTSKRIIADATPRNIGAIYNHDGENEVLKTIQDGMARTFVETCADHPEGIMQVSIPLKLRDREIIGAILFEYTPLYKELMGELRKNLFFVGIIVLLLLFSAGIVSFYFLRKTIISPIEHLRESAKEIGKGNFGIKVNITTQDEIGELTSAFNAMSENVKEYQERLSVELVERKKAEEAVRLSEERYRLIVENIPDVIWASDSEGKTHYISSNIEKVYGFTPEEIYMGGEEIWFGRIHRDDVEKVKRGYEYFFQKGSKFDVEYRIQRKDGNWIWLKDRGMMGFEKEGIRYAYGLFSDITEHKKAEEEREKLILQLEDALTKIKKLSGLLPICSSCKKIRDDKGYWNQIEEFIRDHSEAEFSHGICPECFKKLYPDIDET